ncbi:MAG: ribonuclease III [Phycisphaerae bacterium]
MESHLSDRCEKLLGHEFQDPSLLQQALTHASVAPSREESNERLEFLGDAVLGLVTCHMLYLLADGSMQEGEMTKIKSSVVSRATCARIARRMGLCEFVSVGKGLGDAESVPTSVAAALLEAVIGAIYVDGGYDAAERFVATQLEPCIRSAMDNQHRLNYKSRLQQAVQRRWGTTPQYLLLDEKGPDHSKCFEVAVNVDGRHFPSAWGNSKKEAEQKAAFSALADLGLIREQDAPDPADFDEDFEDFDDAEDAEVM